MTLWSVSMKWFRGWLLICALVLCNLFIAERLCAEGETFSKEHVHGTWKCKFRHFTTLGPCDYNFRLLLISEAGKIYASQVLRGDSLPNSVTIKLKKPPKGRYLVATEVLNGNPQGIVTFQIKLTNNQNESRYFVKQGVVLASPSSLGSRVVISQFAIPK